MGSEQIPTLLLEAAVHAHRGLFGVDLALQKPIPHTEIPPLGSEVDEARHNLEVEAEHATSSPGRHVAIPNYRNVIQDFDDSFPGDKSLPTVYKGP